MDNIPIRILCMNDGNHETCFVTQNSYYHLCDFISRMSQPHTISYEFKHVILDDLPEEDENMFSILADDYNPFVLVESEDFQSYFKRRNQTFEYFWDKGEDGIYV